VGFQSALLCKPESSNGPPDMTARVIIAFLLIFTGCIIPENKPELNDAPVKPTSSRNNVVIANYFPYLIPRSMRFTVQGGFEGGMTKHVEHQFDPSHVLSITKTLHDSGYYLMIAQQKPNIEDLYIVSLSIEYENSQTQNVTEYIRDWKVSPLNLLADRIDKIVRSDMP
jgi:hypothetical protein